MKWANVKTLNSPQTNINRLLSNTNNTVFIFPSGLCCNYNANVGMYSYNNAVISSRFYKEQ